MEPNCDSKSRRKCVSEKKYKFVRAIVAALCVMMLALTVVPSATMYAAEDLDDSYDIAAASNTLGTIMSIGSMPVKEKDGDAASVKGVSVLKNVDYAGNAGMVMAYTTRPTSLGQWLASQVSASSMMYDYQSLTDVPTGDGTTSEVYYYAVYGNLLRQLGLDKTAVAAQSSGNIFRFLGGGIMLVVYVMASAINGLFSVVISLLQLLNPFQWFEWVAKDRSAALGAMYSAENNGTGPFALIFQYIAAIYSSMCNLSWAFIIPMSVALYLANMFLFRKTAGGKRLLKRIIFLSIGVPLVGGTYTSFLNEMQDTFDSSNTYADRAVLSIYCDFEAWAANKHLAVPSGSAFKKGALSAHIPIAINTDGDKTEVKNSTEIGGKETDKALFYLRDTCYAINFMSTPAIASEKANSLSSGFTFSGDFSGEGNIGEDVDYDEIVDDAYENLGITDSEDSDNDGKLFTLDFSNQFENKGTKQRTYVQNLLLRYMNGNYFSAEQYASLIQARMSQLSKGGYATDIYNMMLAMSRYTNIPPYKDDNTLWGKISSLFSEDSNIIEWETASGSADNTSIGNSEANLFGDISIFDDGKLSAKVNDYVVTFTSSGSNSKYTRSYNNAWSTNGGRTGLSTMAMYNYLNSSFSDTGVIVYGGGNAITNGLTKANHYSVNLVGTGFISFIYWLEAIVMMVCVAAVGLLYALGMFIGTVKHTFKAIGAMPLAMLGSFRYIAQFVGTAVAMMANIIVTIIMYGVVVEVLLAIGNILHNNPIILGLAAPFGIMAILLFGGLLYPIILIWLTGTLLRIRKNAVNSVTEWTTQIVGKFFEADGHTAPGKPSANIGSKIAGGLATGAGMAAGAKMAGKAGGMLAGALAGDDAGGGGDGGGTGPDGGGNGIEKESQDHFGTDTSSDSQLLGGESTSESETKDASVDRENDSVDLEKSEATNREAQNSEQALIAASNNTHDAKASQSADHSRQQSDSSTHASDESTSSTHDSDEKASQEKSNREAQSDKDRSAELSSSKQETSDKQSQAMSQATQVLDKAEQHDSTGTAGLVNDTVKSLDKAGKDLKEGDVKGAVKDTAGAAAGIAVTAATGSTQAGNATSKVVDGAAHGDKGRMAQGAMALAGAPSGANGVAGQMPGGANGGAKQLGGAAPTDAPKKSLGDAKQLGGAAPTDAPKKSLGGADSGQKPSTTSNSQGSPNSGQKPSTTSNSQGSPNSGQKQASAVDGGKSTSHTASLKAGGMMVNSNITNNISNGGTINTQNVQQGGPSMNMTNSAGNNVNNTTNVTNNNAGGGGHTVQAGGGGHTVQAVGGGNVVNNSAGRNVQNITNVNNVNNVQNMQRGGGNAGAVNGGKNVQNVTNVNNAQTVNNVNANSSFENRSRK